MNQVQLTAFIFLTHLLIDIGGRCRALNHRPRMLSIKDIIKSSAVLKRKRTTFNSSPTDQRNWLTVIFAHVYFLLYDE